MFTTIKRLLTRATEMPRWKGSRAATRRNFVLRGAALGLGMSLPARLWMRTISEHHVFSVPGTLLIVLFFTGMGGLAGLVAWWRRNPERPRTLVVRAAGFAPFALLGPFTLLFIPSFLAALVSGHPAWRRWARSAAAIFGVLVFGFTELILLTADVPGSGAVRLASGLLYLPLSYALFISNRLAFDPLPGRRPAAA